MWFPSGAIDENIKMDKILIAMRKDGHLNNIISIQQKACGRFEIEMKNETSMLKIINEGVEIRKQLINIKSCKYHQLQVTVYGLPLSVSTDSLAAQLCDYGKISGWDDIQK